MLAQATLNSLQRRRRDVAPPAARAAVAAHTHTQPLSRDDEERMVQEAILLSGRSEPRAPAAAAAAAPSAPPASHVFAVPSAPPAMAPAGLFFHAVEEDGVD